VGKYQERVYRLTCSTAGLISFNVKVKETDLWILAERDLSRAAVDSVLNHRRGLEKYLARKPEAAVSLDPLADDPLAPLLVRSMLKAGQKAGTGPMAAVAGAIAQVVGNDLLRLSRQIVVENGGDLFLAATQNINVAIWAGDSPLSGRIGIEVAAEQMPIGLATSSGTVGHSMSLGKADAALVASGDVALADAVATAMGNRVRSVSDLDQALAWAGEIPGVSGALIVLGDRLGAWGDLHLIELGAGEDK
jgi:ApbE superfamily uncharacterized protein (UPF0280 family)